MFMPDIRDEEKAAIRELSKVFVKHIWKVPFNEGLIAYTKASEQVYVHPARWKICFKCGEINKKESMSNEKHTCALDFSGFPIITQTSWYKLKSFFLGNLYTDLLKELGVKELPKPIIKEKLVQESSTIVKESAKAKET